MEVLTNRNSFSIYEYKVQSFKIIYFTGFIFLISITFFLFKGLFNSKIIDIVLAYNPLLNCFVHADFDHLFNNMALLIILLFCKENHSLTIADLILYAILISIICSIFILFGISEQMIGISGLIYMLLTKLFLNIRIKYVFKIILFFLTVGEIIGIENKDNISHLTHLVGITLGCIIYLKKQNYDDKKVYK